MALIKRLVSKTITYDSNATGAVRLKPLSLRQYLNCREMIIEIKDYMRTHDRTILKTISHLINTVKDDIIRQNSLPPALIKNMDIAVFSDFLNHLLPDSHSSKSQLANTPKEQLDPAYAAGKIMTVFHCYTIEDLLDLPVQNFFALYELAVRMHADYALEVNYAAGAALHNGNTGALRHQQGSRDTGSNNEEFREVRRLAQQLISQTQKENE